jgi:hypothetical protein
VHRKQPKRLLSRTKGGEQSAFGPTPPEAASHFEISAASPPRQAGGLGVQSQGPAD